MEGVEQLREVSRTVDARSGEEAGDRESPEFSHSAGEGLCEMPVSLRKRPVSLRKDWSGRPDLNRGLLRPRQARWPNNHLLAAQL